MLALTALPSIAIAWQAHIDGTASRDDSVAAVAADAVGDVISVGWLNNSSTNYDFTVIKLDGSVGSVLWRQGIDGAGSSRDGAYSVAIDSSGDVIAGGALENSGTGRDFTVIKFNGSTGAELWRQEINGTASGSDEAYSVAVDGSGDVIAGGSVENSGTGEDFTVVKLDGSTGGELWHQDIDGTASHEEWAARVTVDGLGNVIAVGKLRGSAGTKADFAVIKFDGSTGAELWRREIDGAAHESDYARSVAVDGSGDVIAGGALAGGRGTGYFNFVVLKFSGATGTELWRQEINGSGSSTWDVAHAVAVDGSGDVIAAGDIEYGDNEEFTVIKFDGSTGAELWRQELGGTDDEWGDGAYSVTVDGSRDVIAAGLFKNSGSYLDFAVIKIDGSTGSVLWRREINGTASGRDVAHRVAVDGSGDVIAGGHVENLDTGEDFTVIKLLGSTGFESPAALVSGRRLLVKDKDRDPWKRSVILESRDPSIAPASPGTPGDPTLGGGELRVLNPISLEETVISLPPGNWVGLGNPAGARGYKYRDRSPSRGPCRTALIKHGKLKTACKGRQIGFTLDEVSQVSLAATFGLGIDRAYCMEFGGTIQQDKQAVSGKTGVFNAKDARVPLVCPIE
jgi:outer membrane protein assembly factor BamB